MVPVVLKLALAVVAALVVGVVVVPQPAAAASVVTVHEIWVSVVGVSKTTTDDVNAVPANAAEARDFVKKMNDYWNRESGGTISLVLGGIEARSFVNSCSLGSVMSKLQSVAFGGQFAKRTAHRHLLTLTREACGVGQGTVGAPGGLMAVGVGTSDQYGLGVAVHEFGHNLGFDHANAAICDSGDASDSLFAKKCTTTTYADQLDVMASAAAYSVPHLSSPQRIRAGFMSDSIALSARSGLHTATIEPLGAADGTRAAVITSPDGGEVYFIEYRTADAADATSPEFTASDSCTYATSGVRCFSTANAATGVLRVLRLVGSATVALAVGTTSSGQRDMHLDAGETFTSYDGSFSLRVESLDPTIGAGITVAFGTTPLPALVTAVDPQKVTDTVTASVPRIVEISYPAPVRLMTPPVAVQKFESTTRVSVKKRSVTVKIDGEAAPTGRIAIYVDGRKTMTVKARSWTTKVTLPKKVKRGTHWITARYLGDESHTASRSVKRKIRLT